MISSRGQPYKRQPASDAYDASIGCEPTNLAVSHHHQRLGALYAFAGLYTISCLLSLLSKTRTSLTRSP